MNKIGIMQGRLLPKDLKKYQVFPSETWEEEFEVCKNNGFSTIELLFDIDAYYDNPLMYRSGQQRIVELSESTNVSVSSVCADFFKKYGFFQRSPQTKEGNIFMLKKLIGACKVIQCDTILVPFVEESSISSRKDEDDIIGVINLVGELLERQGINLCLEATLQWQEMLEFLEKIGHPKVGVYYDIGNSVYLKYDPVEEIRRLSKWIGGVHIKDRDKEGRNVMLGTGLVDFPACFKSLKKVRYKGSYILETTMCDNPIEAAKKNLEFVKTLL